MVCRLDLLRTILQHRRAGETEQRHLHVRLPARHPHIAHQQIAHQDRARAHLSFAHCQRVYPATGRPLRKIQTPVPKRICSRSCRFLCAGVIAEGGRHVLAHIGPTPHVDRPVALHDGMVAPHLRQSQLGGSGDGDKQEGREEYSARKPWKRHRSPKMPQIAARENRLQRYLQVRSASSSGRRRPCVGAPLPRPLSRRPN